MKIDIKIYKPAYELTTGYYTITCKPGIPPEKLPTAAITYKEDGPINSTQWEDITTKLIKEIIMSINKDIKNRDITLPFTVQDLEQDKERLSKFFTKSFSNNLFSDDNIQTALQLFCNLCAKLCASDTTRHSKNLMIHGGVTLYEVVVVSLMIACKYDEDNPFENKSWSYLSGIDLEIINIIEKKYLHLIDVFGEIDFSHIKFTLYFPDVTTNPAECKIMYFPGLTPKPNAAYAVNYKFFVNQLDYAAGNYLKEYIDAVIECMNDIREKTRLKNQVYNQVNDQYYTEFIIKGLSNGLFEQKDIENGLQHFANICTSLSCPQHKSDNNQDINYLITNHDRLFLISIMLANRTRNFASFDYNAWSRASSIHAGDLRRLLQHYNRYTTTYQIVTPSPTSASHIVAGPSRNRVNQPKNNENNNNNNDLPPNFWG